MSRPSISAVFITYNEEHSLARALESVSWVDEIVVLDSGSTDATEEIARRFTDRFLTHPWDGYGPQRQRAIEQARGDWILVVDADEVVPPALREEIESAVREPGDRVGFRVEWQVCYLGERFGTRGWHKEWRRRLFRRGAARYHDDVIHERMTLDGPVGTLRGAILHYSYRNLTHQIEKVNRYTTTIAADRVQRGRRSGVAAALLWGAGYFLKAYFGRGRILYGRAGFVDATVSGITGYLKRIKLWELGLPAEERGTAEVRDTAPPARLSAGHAEE
jgi:glycosyltransferase involved in cell wall biosynthesis